MDVDDTDSGDRDRAGDVDDDGEDSCITRGVARPMPIEFDTARKFSGTVGDAARPALVTRESAAT